VAIERPIDRTQWAVDRPVNHTQQRRNVTQSVDRQQVLLIDWHTCGQVLGPIYSQRSKIEFRFPFQAHSSFFSGKFRIKLKFYSLKDLFLKIKEFRIVVDQKINFLRIDQVLQASDGQDYLIVRIGYVL